MRHVGLGHAVHKPVLLSDRLCSEKAAQEEAEVERSEGEGDAQGRLVVGGRCDFGLWKWISYLIEPERGSERLCVRICARRRRPKSDTGDILAVRRE